jgi:hypothetical protein
MLMAEARPAGPQGERPKVRRYRLARLHVGPLPEARRSGVEQQKSAGH